MIELLKAIHAFVVDSASGPLTNTIANGFHTLIAPSRDGDGSGNPILGNYCVVTPASAPLTSGYGSAAVGEPELQFAVYGTSAQAMAGIRAIVAAFDNHTFTLATGHNLDTLRLTEPMPMPGLPETGENGQPVYGWFVSYRFATTSY